jgi:hypothetical protein
MEPEIKDVTSTSFGLLIAYLAPGLAGLYTTSFYSPDVRDFLKNAKGAEDFLLILLAALIVGMLLNGMHFVGLHLLCNKAWGWGWNMAENDFKKLQDAEKLACYLAVLSEYYRAHQFFGAMAIVIPFFYFGRGVHSVWYTLGFAVLWTVTTLASIVSWKYQVEIGSKVLQG